MTGPDRPGGSRFTSPFAVRHAPMRRLMLVNIAGEPRCPGIEPQLFDDPVHGTGAAVLVYRPDRLVDVYHQPGVRLDPEAYAVGAGLGRMIERPLDDLRFEIGPDGVDLEVHLVDADGMAIDVRVREHRRGAMTPLSLLAPIGGDIDHPRSLPLFFLYEFTLVPRRGTEVEIRVDGVERAPVSFPVPLGRHRYWFLRYGAAPFICELNPAHEGPLPVLDVAAGSGERHGARHDIVVHDGRPALARLAVAADGHALTMDFDPPFPDPARLDDGSALAGRFRILASGAAGRIDGRWSASRAGRGVELSLHPAGGWRTAERGIVFPLVFRVPAFRRWPATYRWSARLDLGDDPGASVVMRSSWTRSSSDGRPTKRGRKVDGR